MLKIQQQKNTNWSTISAKISYFNEMYTNGKNQFIFIRSNLNNKSSTASKLSEA